MVRKTFLVLLAALPLIWLGRAEAQQPGKFHRIGLLISASDVIAPFTDAFRQGLGELGYVEKKDYILEIRGGNSSRSRPNCCDIPHEDKIWGRRAMAQGNRSGGQNVRFKIQESWTRPRFGNLGRRL
jgi:hypothetical protein